jgi:hypothetical protein
MLLKILEDIETTFHFVFVSKRLLSLETTGLI